MTLCSNLSMVKAVFFDIDGTLVPIGESKMVESAYRAIKSLQEKGIKCIVCSGRDFREVGRGNDVLDRIKFDGIIASTGQCCIDKDGVPFYIQTFDDKQTDEVISLFKQKEYAICLKSEYGSYINCVNSLNGNIYNKLKKEVFPIKEYQGERIYQALIYAGKEDIEILKQNLKNLKITSWHPLMADLIPLDGGKAKGIKRFIDKYNIKLEETMAFGDSNNDHDMLKYVDIGVAMGNSDSELKKIADYVTSDCKDDGVYLALKHFGLI